MTTKATEDIMIPHNQPEILVPFLEAVPYATITNISVEKLFGQYDYNLSVNFRSVVGSSDSRILLLYGENGTGKTTILNLMYHLLSPASGRGHRSYLAETPFERFTVTIEDGTTISATREAPNLIGSYVITVLERGNVTHTFAMEVNERGKVTRSSIDDQGKTDEGLTQFLGDLSINPRYLTESRIYQSDEDEVDPERHRVVVTSETEQYYYVQRSGRIEAVDTKDSPRSVRQGRELAEALFRVELWLRRKSYRGTSTGSRNTNAIYLEVVKQIAASPQGTETGPPNMDGRRLKTRISELERRSSQYAQYGFGTLFSGDGFLWAVDNADGDKLHIIERVLTPHLDAVEAQLNALSDVYEVVLKFETAVNSFLAGKYMSVHVDEGISISKSGGDALSPSVLSSGEKQLLLLLATTVVARETSKLFLIDEPEISLNAKWQRKLLGALLDCTVGTRLQFVVATHSVEMIARHRNSLAKLVNQDA
ncbi:MAG: hypothetical protein QOJ59_4714 [Thermomicrobiales bacterium]|nr:hypothetical protein [Thermomicrobiales bacterium]